MEQLTVPGPRTALEQEALVHTLEQALEPVLLEQPAGDLVPGQCVKLPGNVCAQVYEMYELVPGYLAVVLDTPFGRKHIALRHDDVVLVCT